MSDSFLLPQDYCNVDVGRRRLLFDCLRPLGTSPRPFPNSLSSVVDKKVYPTPHPGAGWHERDPEQYQLRPVPPPSARWSAAVRHRNPPLGEGRQCCHHGR
eukprot:1296463-Rhodomonas_salina.1